MNQSAKTLSFFLLFGLMAFMPDSWAAGTADPGISPITPDSTASLAKAIVKVAGALTLVVGLMMLTMKIIRKLGMGRSNLATGSLISILDTKMIAPKKYVAVLRIADELVAVGITDQQISLLSHIENSDNAISLSEQDKASSGFSFPDFLDRAKDSIKSIKNQQ